MAAVTLSLVAQIGAGRGRRRPAAGRGRSSRCSSCSRSGRTRPPRAAWPGPSTSRTRPLTRARPPPRSSRRRVMTSKVRHAPLWMCQPEQRGIDIGAQGVDVVQHQVLATAGARPAAAPARRCAAGWALRTNGRPGAGTGAAGCRCSRWLRRRCCAQSISAWRRLSRTFCCCSSSICCGISSQANRRSRTVGTMRRPTDRPRREQQRALVAVVVLPRPGTPRSARGSGSWW